MKRIHTAKVAFGGLLLLPAVLGMTGCRWASGPGDTVETPPRALVEKTFRVPPRGARGTPAPNNVNLPGTASGQAASK